MKAFVISVLILSLVGCGRGFRAGNFAESDLAQSQSGGDDSIDAFYIDESEIVEEQLELDLGDRTDAPTEEQIELPLEEDKKDETKKEEVEETKSTDEPKTTEEPKVNGERLEILKSDMGRAQLLKPTVYYLPSNDNSPFRSCKANDTKFLKAKTGQTLVSGKSEIKVCSKFYFAAQMQGSALVRTNDGRQYLINYVGAEGGLPRYKVIDREICPYGLGVSNLCLQPFISIAADRNLYKAGDVIYVPAVAKAKIELADGDIHQGFFIVTDTGQAIVGTGRFDFYTGPMHYSDPANPFVKLSLQSKINKAKLSYHLVKRDSKTASEVLDYYKGRQIIPYTK